MKPLISVIIPVYAVEKYLERAVNSVLAQSYDNLEIILVDDGSPDQCPVICDAFARNENRVRVIHKINGGLSDARNAGLDAAKGEYIAFLDSDDYWAPFFLEVLYEQLRETESDVALCQYEVTEQLSIEAGPDFESVLQRYRERKAEISCYNRGQMLLNQYDAICEDATYFIVAWNKLYKASLWTNLRFPKGKIHEDEATTYRIFDRIQKGVYIHLPMYAYYSMPESITRSGFTLKRLQWFDALDDRISFFEEKGERDAMQAALRARADGAVRYYYPLAAQYPHAKEERKRLKECVKKALQMNSHIKKPQKAFLGNVTRIGYRLFLLLPGLYGKLTGIV